MSKKNRRKIFDIMEQIDEICDSALKEGEEKEDGEPAEHREDPAQGEPRKWKDGTGEPKNKNCRRYSSAFKRMIVHLHRDEGYTFERITLQYGVSKATVVRWCSDSRYEKRILMDDVNREMASIREENEKLKEENNFLKTVLTSVFGREIVNVFPDSKPDEAASAAAY